MAQQQQLSRDERLSRRSCLLFASLAGILPPLEATAATDEKIRNLYDKAAGASSFLRDKKPSSLQQPIAAYQNAQVDVNAKPNRLNN